MYMQPPIPSSRNSFHKESPLVVWATGEEKNDRKVSSPQIFPRIVYILARSIGNIGQCCDLEKNLTEINFKQFVIVKDLKGTEVIHQVVITLTACSNELGLGDFQMNLMTSQEVL
jgi:hypothetical protein